MAEAQSRCYRVPHYQDLLDFMNLCAQVSQTSSSETRKPSKSEFRKHFQSSKQVTSFATNTITFKIQVCGLLKPERHLLFNCNKFKELAHDGKPSVLKLTKYVITVCKLVIMLDSVNLFIVAGSVIVSTTLYYTMNKSLTPAPRKNSYVRSQRMQPWVSSRNRS